MSRLSFSRSVHNNFEFDLGENQQKRPKFLSFFRDFLFNPLYDFRIQGQAYRLIIQLGQICSTQKSTANMLSRRYQNSRKSENTQVSEVNSNLYLEICQKHDTSLQSQDISCFYHFSFSRYLELAERHFSSDILVPFPGSGVLYSRDVKRKSNISFSH